MTRGIQLIVGLGNPGSEYASTRHNVGYWLVEKLCDQSSAKLELEQKFKGLVAKISTPHLVRVLEPITFMNRSGQAVWSLAHFYKILPHEILVVHDDLDLPAGSARLKLDGGHGGHNGLRDIIAHLGTKNFYRLRIGIGHPGNKEEVLDYVLHRPSLSDKEKILTAIDHSLDVMSDIFQGNTEKAMNKLHTITK
ncbi:MAG: aminoacyl-tRNA hydrolase [Candidatus Berkiellales bacterium]